MHSHLWVAAPPAADQMWSRLSLPPLASCAPLGDHFRPHTSCSWPRSVAVTCSRILRPPPPHRVLIFPCHRACKGRRHALPILISQRDRAGQACLNP